MNEDDIFRGARNLLVSCAGATAGDHVLIVADCESRSLFEPELAADIASAARKLGMLPEILVVEPGSSAEDFPHAVSEAMKESEITVFLSRLGDQVRFVETPATGTSVMTYTLTRRHLSSAFARTDFNLTERILARLVACMTNARCYRIRDRAGTDLSGEIVRNDQQPALIPFTLKLFPTMIFPPVSVQALHGRIVVDHFVLSSSTRVYEDSTLVLDSPVTATVDDGVMTDFVGESSVVDALVDQCRRAAALTGGDPFRLNSWHVGVNPHTFFEGSPYSDPERWGTVSYGSPRYLHFHAAGRDPGDLAIQLFDATVIIDDEPFWQDGRFVFLDRPDVRALLEDAGEGELTSATSADIGIAPPSENPMFAAVM